MSNVPSYKNLPSVDEEMSKYQPKSNLYQRYGHVGPGQQKRAKPVLHNAASNAEIASYARLNQQDGGSYAPVLSRARSKDHLGLQGLQHQNSRDKYMQLAGAQRVL